MSDASITPITPIDSIAAAREENATPARGPRAVEEPRAKPERLDNPAPEITLTVAETVIPEAVDQLLAHSRRYPLLTPAQEIDLAQRIERGDLHAKELLVNSNLRLVASNARRYQNQGLACFTISSSRVIHHRSIPRLS